MPIDYSEDEDNEVPQKGIRRYITTEDLDIMRLNPIKHDFNPDIYKNVYSSGNSDNWHCTRKGCKQHGDKWWMMVHTCRPYILEQLKKKKEVSESEPEEGSLFW